MLYVGRAIRTFAPALLVGAISAATLSVPAQAGQVGAVKDGWLVMKVHSEMVDEDVLNGSDIDVDVKNGVVTLQGTVPSEAARSRALAVAKANDGVKSVVDQLRIAPAAQATTAKARSRLLARRPRTRPPARRRRPAAQSTTAGSSRRSMRSTWPTGTPCSTTATSTSTSRTTS